MRSRALDVIRCQAASGDQAAQLFRLVLTDVAAGHGQHDKEQGSLPEGVKGRESPRASGNGELTRQAVLAASGQFRERELDGRVELGDPPAGRALLPGHVRSDPVSRDHGDPVCKQSG